MIIFLYFSDGTESDEHSDRENSHSPEPHHHIQNHDRPTALNLVSILFLS